MFYFTYVLRSLKDDGIYIGYTNNLKHRLKLHNSGKVIATRDRLPVILVYFEGCTNKELAIKREKTLKTGFGRKYLKTRI
ncbi:MAG: GIY-YIG nuclease family protein [Candidatus Shapirobacteria bacterium]|jgi:putative endonuclease